MPVSESQWDYQSRPDLDLTQVPLPNESHIKKACWWAKKLDWQKQNEIERAGNPYEQSALAKEFEHYRKKAGTTQLLPSQLPGRARFKRLRNTWTERDLHRTPPHNRTPSLNTIPTTSEVEANHQRQKSIAGPIPNPTTVIPNNPPLTLTAGPIKKPKGPGRPRSRKKAPPIKPQVPVIPSPMKTTLPKETAPARGTPAWYQELRKQVQNHDAQESSEEKSSQKTRLPFPQTRERVSTIFKKTASIEAPEVKKEESIDFKGIREPLSPSSSLPTLSSKPIENRPSVVPPYPEQDNTISLLFRFLVWDYKGRDFGEPKEPSTWEKVADYTDNWWNRTQKTCNDIWKFLV